MITITQYFYNWAHLLQEEKVKGLLEARTEAILTDVSIQPVSE